MTIKALRFALTVLKHGKHDQSSHGRRGSGGGGLAPATMGARPAKPSLQQIIDSARFYPDLPNDYTPEQTQVMEQHLQTMQRHMERTEQIRTRHFNPDGTPKTPTSRKECFDELRQHAKQIIKDSVDVQKKMRYPDGDQSFEHVSGEGDYQEHASRMRGNHVNVMNAITLEAWRQNTPGTVPTLDNTNALPLREYNAIFSELDSLFQYVHTAPGDENAPSLNGLPIEIRSNPSDTKIGGFFVGVSANADGVISPNAHAVISINYDSTDAKFVPVAQHEGTHLVQSMKPHYIDADVQFLRDRGGNYPKDMLQENYAVTITDVYAKTHYPYAKTVYYRGQKADHLKFDPSAYSRVRPVATEIATTTAENVFGYARGDWKTVRDISDVFSKIPDEAALTYALFNS
jgi:hypothetical protein